MASFEMAFEYTMRHEDPKLLGQVVKEPKGGVARFGVNSIAHPEAVYAGFYEMPRGEALGYASSLFRKSYFEPIGGFQLADQTVANKFFDLAVNDGVVEATKIMQRAANSLLHGPALLTVDGRTGLRTLDALNQAMPSELLAAIRSYGKQFYEDIARRDPVLAPCLSLWLHRLDN